jgi:phage terminase large subunit-like protein
VAANPASWINAEVLTRAKDSPTIDELTFRRLHLNQWTKTREAWLPAGLWESLKSQEKIPEGADVFIGVDVGLVNDTTAVSVAYQLDDGRVVVRAKVWAARDDAVADVVMPGGRVDLIVIEDHIRAIAEVYNVRELVADPKFFERSMQVLAAEGLNVAPIDQASRRMLEAYSTFYTACREERVMHDGSPVLSRHVESTNATMTERGWKISRLRNHRIDACVATVMAHYRASRSAPETYLMFGDDEVSA